MYLSPDVGSRAPLGLAWGLSTAGRDGESPVTVLLTFSGIKQAAQVQLGSKLIVFVTFEVSKLSQLDKSFLKQTKTQVICLLV